MPENPFARRQYILPELRQAEQIVIVGWPPAAQGSVSLYNQDKLPDLHGRGLLTFSPRTPGEIHVTTSSGYVGMLILRRE